MVASWHGRSWPGAIGSEAPSPTSRSVDAARRRHALVTGITGQDGSFLAELLLEKGYRRRRHDPVASRRAAGVLRASARTGRAGHGDLLDPESLRAAVARRRRTSSTTSPRLRSSPDSWERPAETLAAIAGATASLLEAVREHSRAHAGVRRRLRRDVRRRAREPAARGHAVPARDAIRHREAAAHQSSGRCAPRRDVRVLRDPLQPRVRAPARAFVTRKITRAAAAIKLGLAEDVVLGDMSASATGRSPAT